MPFNAGGFVPIGITITLANGDVITRKLAAFHARIETMAPAWEQVGEDLLGDFADNFAYEGDLMTRGEGWEGLADSTVHDRLRRGYDGEHPILWRTGALRDSASVRGAPGNVFEVGDNSLRVGTSWFSARWHQQGTSRMPARPITGLTRARQAGIVERLNQYVQQQIVDSGL